MSNTKTVWVAYTNSDLNEGRGYDIPIATCEMEITAHRLARRQYVQGTNGPVRKTELIELDGKWYVPSAAVDIVKPSKEDIAAQAKRDAVQAALFKAKDAGLTMDDLKLLGWKEQGE